VAVAPDGTVSDVMLDQSSQQPDLDRQAILATQKVRFQPTDAPGPAWGDVTIAWYYTPKPKEVAPPSAPLAP
jgi:TonB family protein